MNITIAGAGHVGLSNAVLLAQNRQVIVYDNDNEKIIKINNPVFLIFDHAIQTDLNNFKLNLRTMTEQQEAYKDAEFVVIATSTNYDPDKNNFDTSSVETVIINVISVNPKAFIIIRSTVSDGFTSLEKKKFESKNIIFSPEFLRERQAIHDNLYPSRFIVVEQSERAVSFARSLQEGTIKKDVEVLLTNSTEAEAIKLFPNTYLALCVAFFNELESYVEIRRLNTRQIIQGVSLDPRIEDFYNNPSFGYGGYCLPKTQNNCLLIILMFLKI